jgi:hypothetical protein
MEDIELVIKIPDHLYKLLMEFPTNSNEGTIENVLMKAVEHGTPLPKGHGRIGDLDALREEVSSWGMNDYEPSDFTDAIDQADVIIEADKEANNGNDD